MVRQFHAYGPSHWVILAVFVLGAGLLVWQGRRLTDTPARLLGRVLGAVTAIIYAAILIAGCIPPRIEASVPLRLTDLATAVAAYALWSQRTWA